MLLLHASAALGAAAAATGPCDIYRAGGTPCVAAHSTVRALFGAGPLYQLRRADTNATASSTLAPARGVWSRPRAYSSSNAAVLGVPHSPSRGAPSRTRRAPSSIASASCT